MAFVRNAFVLFLALMEMVDMAIGAAIIYLGVYLYQKFNGVSSGDLNVSTFYYFGIGAWSCGRSGPRRPPRTGLIPRFLSPPATNPPPPRRAPGCMVFGSIIVVLALVGLFRVCKITRYGLLSVQSRARLRGGLGTARARAGRSLTARPPDRPPAPSCAASTHPLWRCPLPSPPNRRWSRPSCTS